MVGDVYRDTERLMAQKKTAGGPPDLKRPFVRGGRAGVKRQPETEPEDTTQNDESGEGEDTVVQEWSDDEGEGENYLPDADINDNAEDTNINPTTYSPPPPMPFSNQQAVLQQIAMLQQQIASMQTPRQPPEPPDPYEVQLNQFASSNQALGVHVQNFHKLLEIQKKYMTYQKALIETFEKSLKIYAKKTSAASQPSTYQQPPLGSNHGATAQSLATPVSQPVVNTRKERMKLMIVLGAGVMLLGGSYYLGVEGNLKTFNILAYICAGIGGGLIAKIFKI